MAVAVQHFAVQTSALTVTMVYAVVSMTAFVLPCIFAFTLHAVLHVSKLTDTAIILGFSCFIRLDGKTRCQNL